MNDLNEPILPDEYPVYFGFFYVCDGKIIENPLFGDESVSITVRELKARLPCSEVRRCDAVGRRLL